MNNIYGIDIKSAFVETTSLCNLSCKHCYNNSGNTPNNISFLDLEHIVFDLVALGAEYVSISGGEPLLHPDFDNIIGLLNKYPIKYQIITNGTLLDRKIDLIEYHKKNLFVQISLDGIGNIHDELRGSGTFESIEKNIKLLKEKNIIYFFKTTIHKNNYTKLEDIVLKAIELGGTSISFSFINPVGRGLINTDLHMTQKEIFLTFNELKLLKEKYERKIKVGIPILYRNSICPWIAYNYENKLKISPRIDVNGEVYLCSAFMNPKFSLGNIKKDSIKEILLSNKEISDLINFLKLYSKYIDCHRCLLNSNCNKGCPASYLEKNTDYDDNFCGSRRIAAVEYISCAEGIADYHPNRSAGT